MHSNPTDIDAYICDRPTAIARMNALGAAGTPFFFLVDYAMARPLVCPLHEVDSRVLRYDVRGLANAPATDVTHRPQQVRFERVPPSFVDYERAFACVQRHLQLGNSFLVNLTFPTSVTTDLGLHEVFHWAKAPYRLWWRDRLVVSSPETFVRIRDGRIATYPMKGTMPADHPAAPEGLLQDPKERAEHATIVDLLRNDLGMVASKVRVLRYRYAQVLPTHHGPLWQTSSEIAGDLPPDYRSHLGDLLFAMLPAGSISGAPKPKTLDIIAEAEPGPRGYYTGVFGVFDGQHLDSAVAIRFMEQTPRGLLYRSGGGITALSRAEAEYQELVDKVYLPFAVQPVVVG